MKNSIVLLILLAGASASAQMSAKQGLEKLDTNIANSKSNITEYEKNLATVETNIGETGKAVSDVEAQKKQVAEQIKENNKTLTALDKKQKEMSGLILDEQSKAKQEEQKIAELQKGIEQLQKNIETRNQNVTAYTEQQKKMEEERGQWKARGQALDQQMAQVTANLSKSKSEQNEWIQKKRGYQGEISRWQKEVDKNQKLRDNMRTLAEVKE